MTQGTDAGIPASAELVAFIDAAVKAGDDLPERRQAVADAISPAGLVDAAAIIGNFERMNRIADGAGIGLDAPVAVISGEIRDELGLDNFETAKNSRPVGPAGRVLGKIAGALLPRLLRFVRG